MDRLDTVRDLEVAVARLSAVEPRFAGVVERHGLPPLRHAEAGLESLLRIVTDQLISLKAGRAIWSRLATRLTFQAAAAAFAAGRFDDAVTLPEDEVERRLLAIPGVGPWTASIYLLTVLRLADAWPAADLALQVAAQDLLALAERPSTRRMVELGQVWRPYRSAAALLLWRHYRGLRGPASG